MTLRSVIPAPSPRGPRPGRPSAAPQSQISNRNSQIKNAFTLIEMLVVIGIIVLIIAFAMPAFQFMSGSRSVEAGQNLLAAMLSTARADAIGVQQPKGVLIYREAATDRMAAAFVEYKSATAWTAGTSYTLGDYVVQTSKYYVCLVSHTAVLATNDPATDDPTAPAGTYWQMIPNGWNYLMSANPVVVDVVADTDRVLLPSGIDCRGAGNAAAVPGGAVTRYLNPAVIMFDGNGTLTTKNFELLAEGIIGSQMNSSSAVPAFLTSGPPPFAQAYGNSTATTNLTSQIGLVLFDEEAFKNSVPATPADTWLDTNATPVMVNRYNGTLVKGE